MKKQLFKIKVILLLFVFMSSCSKGKLEDEGPKEDKPNTSGLYLSYFKKSTAMQELLQTHLSKIKEGHAEYFQNFRAFLGALNALIVIEGETETDDYFLKMQRGAIDEIIATSEISYKLGHYSDDYRSWISSSKAGSVALKEVSLSESYSFFYVTQFLYYLKASNWIAKSEENYNWWIDKVTFVEKNVWEKWRERSVIGYGTKYGNFLRSRTHMGSHWAGIALYLEKLTSNPELKLEYAKVYNDYDILLKRNLKYNTDFPDTYIWNSTWDDISGTDAHKEEGLNNLQDNSHGNHVVAYIIAAYELKSEAWGKSDIQSLCNVIKNVTYNQDKKHFYDYIDGTYAAPYSPDFPAGTPSLGKGNFTADGWIQLSRYDGEVLKIFQAFAKESNGGLLKEYYQELQFKANLLLSEIKRQ